ncbi:MAG TPA: NAD(P)-dependent oxidoreductase, partial [Lysobacter sp.]|nr:NAD(P)-dependent oxidoreductase [Lysobacter sp.]
MKILVTGGGGFLGQALCRGLRERGHEVVSFNRSRYDALDAIGVTQVQGDLAQRDAVIAAAQGCDAVFHNAAK